MYDLIIIGAGPVGLSIALEAKKNGLNYLVLERGVIANSITKYPYFMQFFSLSEQLEIGKIPFFSLGSKPTRKEAISYYQKIVEYHNIPVYQWENVFRVESKKSYLRIYTNNRLYETKDYNSKYLVLSTGGFDEYNPLNIPGEENKNLCSHYYTEGALYSGLNVVIVGGNNSTVEAALDLYRNGANVTIVHRGDQLFHWESDLVNDIKSKIKKGKIDAYFRANLKAIHFGNVDIEHESIIVNKKCDFVFALTGYKANFSLLREIGININQEIISYDENTMETNVQNVFVAGAVLGGLDSFVANGREHSLKIINEIIKRS